MSAIPEDFIKKTSALSDEVTRPFPGARKVFVTGSRPDIRVPMREIAQAPTPASFGAEENPPITVYDTSGPFSDPEVSIDLLRGMPEVRTAWIDERADTEQLPGPSSDYGRARQADPSLAHLRFEHVRAPRRVQQPAVNWLSSATSRSGCACPPAVERPPVNRQGPAAASASTVNCGQRRKTVLVRISICIRLREAELGEHGLDRRVLEAHVGPVAAQHLQIAHAAVVVDDRLQDDVALEPGHAHVLAVELGGDLRRPGPVDAGEVRAGGGAEKSRLTLRPAGSGLEGGLDPGNRRFSRRSAGRSPKRCSGPARRPAP